MRKIPLILLMSSFGFAGTITTIPGNGSITTSPGPGTITFTATAVAGGGGGGIVLDSSTFANRVYEGASPLTWNMTIGSGSNRFLAVGCAGTYATDIATAATVGGYEMTRTTAATEGGTGLSAALFTYVNPPSGSQSIKAFISGGGIGGAKCYAASFSGVAQTSTVEASTATIRPPAGGLYVKPTVTTISDNDVLVEISSDGNDEAPAPTESGQAALFVSDQSGYVVLAGSTRTTTTAGSYSTGWTPNSAPFVSLLIAIKAAP